MFFKFKVSDSANAISTANNDLTGALIIRFLSIPKVISRCKFTPTYQSVTCYIAYSTR